MKTPLLLLRFPFAALILAASVSLCPLDATSQPVPPEPAPIPTPQPDPEPGPSPFPPNPEPTPSPVATEDLVVITGPTTAAPGGYFIVSLKTPPPADNVLVDVVRETPPGVEPIELLGKQPGEVVYLYQQVIEGRYLFRASAQISVDKSEGFDPHDTDELVVTVTAPRPPTPPGPGPTPPGPEPEPEPTPDTVGPIFGVLLYDKESSDTISREQLLTLNSAAFDEYLKAKGLKVDGSVQFRVWDNDKITEASLAEESEVLRKAYAEAKAKYRGRAYLVLSNGTTGYSGELPETESGIFETFRKYGG